MGSISTEKEQTSPLDSFLTSHPAIRLIRYQYLDVSSVLRCITLTATYALSLGPSPHKISAVALDMLPNTTFGPNFHCLGKDDLYPDWSSLRVVKYVESNKGIEEATASVMCYVHGHHVQYDPYYSCPRSILSKVLSTAKNDYGMTFLVGCEIEFFLLDPAKSTTTKTPSSSSIVAASNSGGQYTALSLRHAPILSLLEEIVFTLQDSNIAVETFHGEGEGYEISLGPLPPMAAVDTLVYVREAIYNIAARRGYRATMYPIPFTEAHGTSVMSSIGAHTHFSIDNPTEEKAQHFLAGLLDTLPSLCAFGMPHHDSYGRVGSSIGQAGKWVAYGTENKDCPIRAIRGRTGYWELRFVDATSNLYLFLAAVITAGLSGIQDKLPVRQKDATEDPLADMASEALTALGIVIPLPRSIGDALNELEKEERLETLGRDFLVKYIATKRMEDEAFGPGKMAEEERKACLGGLW